MTLDSSLSITLAPATGPNLINATASTAMSIGSPVYDTMANNLSVAAAQLIEAASKARGGDCEATRTYIARAVELLHGLPSLGPRERHLLVNPVHVVCGGLAAWQMRKVIAHVEANLSRHIHVQELARLVNLSASHFCRTFKCAFGASPSHYVIRRRIEVAQAMMLRTSEPLRSIAVNCGMCDQQHFTRSFRRIVGETPSMWRRTRRGSMNVD
jgi:AraC family transcriptional regulator